MIGRLKALIPQRHPLRLWWHHLKAFLAAVLYRFPARKLTVVGITGTDGKTTTVGMVAHILLKTGHTAGSASTTYFQIGNERKENMTHQTSMSPFVLQRFLRKLVSRGSTHAVVEMSSHGLVQGRVSYTFPSVSAITNTALEHLDYHGSMEQYRKDKGKIFLMLRGRGTMILNAADESYKMYQKIPTREMLTYGNCDADFWLSDISLHATGSSALLHAGSEEPLTLTLSVPGSFNLDNALCAIACCSSLGVPVSRSVEALQDFRSPPGRLEPIEEGQNFSVFVDFTVSLQAYIKTLSTLRSVVGEHGRVLVLCGSCGNRMKEKRPEVGRIASELADVVVVTEDETYGEDPHKVLEEVWAGVQQNKCEAKKIFSRREAIAWILREAKEGDAVVLCGMGPYTSFSTLKGPVPWNEAEIAREILRTLQHTSP